MDRPDLAEELVRLAGEDLEVRSRLADSGALYDGYHPEMRAVHRRNGERLTIILDEIGRWPGFRLVGPDGSRSAFLIAQHDISNPSLIRRARDMYAKAVEIGDGEPSGIAKLEDRIRYLEGRPQRYGTHVGWNERGEFGPWPPVDDPGTVDERRRAVGLEPLAAAVESARAGRPASRPVGEVLAEHRKAAAFAREVGWRTDHP